MHIQSEEEAGAVSILAQLRAIRAVLREMAVAADPPNDRYFELLNRITDTAKDRQRPSKSD